MVEVAVIKRTKWCCGCWRSRQRQKKAFARDREERLLNEKRNYDALKELEERCNGQSNVDLNEINANYVPVGANADGGGSAGRRYTVSIAVPGSILANAQSPELRTYLAGQIGRAAAVFCVDEIVVYDDQSKLTQSQISAYERTGSVSANVNDNSKDGADCNLLLARILQYLETPQYLRKRLFPLQRELKFAGLLNPLDCPHHLRADEIGKLPYREAVVLNKPTKEDGGSYADAGLSKEVLLDRKLAPSTRVTVDFSRCDFNRKRLLAKVVSPNLPRTKHGHYWGYTLRIAKSLFDVLFYDSQEEDEEGRRKVVKRYDLSIGTSERGESVHAVKKLDSFDKCLIVFGGVKGIEAALDSDQKLTDYSDPDSLFDKYVNILPNQGSRTIRTEEAVLIGLGVMDRKLRRFGRK